MSSHTIPSTRAAQSPKRARGPRILTFEGVPPDLAARKTREPSRTAMHGAAVYRSDVAAALLEHGAFDQYWFIERGHWARASEDSSELHAAFQNRAGTRRFAAADFRQLRGVTDHVLMSGGPNLLNLLPIRAHLQRREWPIVGIAHSLNASTMAPMLISMLVDDFDRHDMLLCSSRTGERALRGQIERLRDYLNPRHEFRVQLPVIPLGLDVPHFQSTARHDARAAMTLPDEAVALLYLGRFSPGNKCDLMPLLVAFREVHRRYPHAKLIVAGDDTAYHLTPALRACADAFGLRDAVIVEPDPAEARKLVLLAAADVFVAVSDNLQETFGISVAEAMASGLPVVAADWDGYRDLVTHGETGLLVPTFLPRLGIEHHMLSSFGNWQADSILAATTVIDLPHLATALGQLIACGERRVDMGRRARAIAAARFDWPVVIRGYEQLWDEALRIGRRVRARRCRAGLFSYEYDQIFGHYATGFLDDHLPLRVRAEAAVAPSACQLVIDASPRFVGALFTSLIGEIKEHGPVSLHDLLERSRRAVSGEDEANDYLVRTHVARLMKYGIIEPATETAAETASRVGASRSSSESSAR